eukprot:gnl/Dysnectes_brevis/2987_a3680_779.p1 GENE.gnl/Dysnectes_brevis/2987_a3680_779~~gnl/Dysnectes_brevis/2987_a3680_779.p1  ORF type:complete len:2302 (-),score=441.14 gnl/Dysnectes_brevis/2987_a3680_779:144-6620(-)
MTSDLTLPVKASRIRTPLLEAVHIPPVVRPDSIAQATMPVRTSLPAWARPALQGFKELNPVQTACFDPAYNKSYNLLVAAPTGSGKTNVALITILRELQLAIRSAGFDPTDDVISEVPDAVLEEEEDADVPTAAAAATAAGPCLKGGRIRPSILAGFLVVYLTPMKALATEITSKLTSRLSRLGLRCRECTGDETPTPAELKDTHCLICTPEKYDVLTRRPFDNDDSEGAHPLNRQRLLVIDEVHLVGVGERGPVIESLVARIWQHVEASQRPLRVVGISATVPNYTDVARFLRVPLDKGCLVFGPEYRPCPLGQTFIGLREKVSAAEGEFGEVPSIARLPGLQCTQAEQYRSFPFVDHRSGAVDEHPAMDAICHHVVCDQIRSGRQTLVFVHSRVGTAKVANSLAPVINGLLEDSPHLTPEPLSKSLLSRFGSELATTCNTGRVGYHHAGLNKDQRRAVEQAFSKGQLLCLCCTATLAWGVNLPAATVIIRGTSIFSSEQAKFVDMDPLDIQQIFGRAGRPQYGQDGQGVIICAHNKLTKFIKEMMSERPIESHMLENRRIGNCLNGEIVLGNLSSLHECRSWFDRTYLSIRMSQNPKLYGYDMGSEAGMFDTHRAREEVLLTAIARLHRCHIVSYDPKTTTLATTELGRVASYYYVSPETINDFHKGLGSKMCAPLTHGELLLLLCQAPEFQQLRVRKSELSELVRISGRSLSFFESEHGDAMEGTRRGRKSGKDELKRALGNLQKDQRKKGRAGALSGAGGSDSLCPLGFGDLDEESPAFKASALLQSFVSGSAPDTGSLALDTNYCVSIAPRMLRAFMEVAIILRRADAAAKLLDLAQSIEYQTWFDRSTLWPLIKHQVTTRSHTSRSGRLGAASKRWGRLSAQMITRLERASDRGRRTEPWDLMDMPTGEISDMTGNKMDGQIIKQACRAVPTLRPEALIKPITYRIWKVTLTLIPSFKWEPRTHGEYLDFWVWVSNPSTGLAYHHDCVGISHAKRHAGTEMEVWLRFPERDGPPPSALLVSIRPDRWAGKGCAKIEYVDTTHIAPPLEQGGMQYTVIPPTLLPLNTAVLHWPQAEKSLYPRFSYFNVLQTLMLHRVYNSRDNVFIGAPTGSGKTAMAELAILQMMRDTPNLKAIYIAPLKALVRERFEDWSQRFGKMGVTIIEMTGEALPSMGSVAKANIIVTTPEKWDAVSRHWKWKGWIQMVGLAIFDEMHLLGTDRGYVLESIVSRFRYAIEEFERTSVDILTGGVDSQQTVSSSDDLLLTGTGKKRKHQGKKPRGGASASGKRKAVLAPVRILALSTAISNIDDVCGWIKVPRHCCFNFPGSARPVRLETHIQGFSGRFYCPRMATMNKPVFQAIKTHACPGAGWDSILPTIVFVSSRRQTRLTARALIAHASSDPMFGDPTFMQLEEGMPSDEDCRFCLSRGVGIHHAGMPKTDRSLIEAMFRDGRLKVLVATSTLAWGVNLPAYLVVVKGCEYFDGKIGRYRAFTITDLAQMIGRAGRPGFVADRALKRIRRALGDDAFTKNQAAIKQAVGACGQVNYHALASSLRTPHMSDKVWGGIWEACDTLAKLSDNEPQSVAVIMCKNEMKPFYRRFFTEPFPIESSMITTTEGPSDNLADVVNGEIASFEGRSRYQIRRWLANTFLYSRAARNPSYYAIPFEETVEDARAMSPAEFSGSDLQMELTFLAKATRQLDPKDPLSRIEHVPESWEDLSNGAICIALFRKLDRTLDILVREGLLKITDEGKVTGQLSNPKYQCTPLGDICSRYYISHESASLLRDVGLEIDTMNWSDGFIRFFEALCSCHEFELLPVRHNEDRDMMELADREEIRQKASKLFRGGLRIAMPAFYAPAEPAYKTHLLIQTQMSRACPAPPPTMPSSDFWLDLATVMDNAVRLAVAAAEYFLARAEAAIGPALSALRMSQALVQGLWPDLDARMCLGALRGTGCMARLAALNAAGLTTLPAVIGSYPTSKDHGKLRAWRRRFRKLIGGRVEALERDLSYLPLHTVHVKARSVLDPDTKDKEKKLQDDPSGVFVSSGAVYEIVVETRQRGRGPQPQFRSSIYPRSKPHTWFHVLSAGEEADSGVVAFQRLSGSARGGRSTFMARAPTGTLQLWILSDCFLGLDQRHQLQLSEVRGEWTDVLKVSSAR